MLYGKSEFKPKCTLEEFLFCFESYVWFFNCQDVKLNKGIYFSWKVLPVHILKWVIFALYFIQNSYPKKPEILKNFGENCYLKLLIEKGNLYNSSLKKEEILNSTLAEFFLEIESIYNLMKI